MDVAGWRIWYADGLVFSSLDGAWTDAPARGVIGIGVYYDAFAGGGIRYRMFRDGGDWYWPFEKSRTNDGHGVWIPPPPYVPARLLKRGVWTSTEDFVRITREMRASQWP